MCWRRRWRRSGGRCGRPPQRSLRQRASRCSNVLPAAPPHSALAAIPSVVQGQRVCVAAYCPAATVAGELCRVGRAVPCPMLAPSKHTVAAPHPTTTGGAHRPRHLRPVGRRGLHRGGHPGAQGESCAASSHTDPTPAAADTLACAGHAELFQPLLSFCLPASAARRCILSHSRSVAVLSAPFALRRCWATACTACLWTTGCCGTRRRSA
jgi:hypothetical protein